MTETTPWRISADRLATLLDGVGQRPESVDARDDLVARALWHVVAEPGDGAVGHLADGGGLVPAARALVDGVDAPALARLSQGALGPADAAAALRRWTPRLRADDVVRALEIAARVQARLLTPADDDWPPGLARLGPHRPHLLWVRGQSQRLRVAAVALVGARAATGYGEHVAMELAAGLCARDIAVVSGGAYGIDGAAHRAALASQGSTVAVLAGGADRLYPSGHDALLTRVIHEGAVISETPCGTPPTRWRFLQRNRVIAAMADAVVVVEAGHRSGALNTAHHASTVGVPLGAVPGPVTSASSAGCHRLLRTTDAVCVTSTADIVELAYGDQPDGNGLTFGVAVTPEARRVTDALRPRRGQSVDELARASGLSTDDVRGALGLLEFEGGACRDGDGLWRTPPPPRPGGKKSETSSPEGDSMRP